jgi:hypothetical protein
VFWNNITSANIGQTIGANTIIVNNEMLYVLGNTFTIANINFPGAFTTVTQIHYGDLNNANDRIIASNGNIDLTLTQLGLNYAGVTVDGNTFTGNVFDSTIQSFYSNVFGVNPTDIAIDGGQYISTLESYAPEELVPGRMLDSLNLSVYDNNNSNVTLTTETIAFRLFDNMSGIQYSQRIASANITTLTSNLNINDTSISVANASLLPLPNPSQHTPGVIVINGEKIIYWRNYALETPTVWSANAIINTNTLISYSGNLYISTGNIYGSYFANITGNVTQVQANTLAQIRRGVDGTSTPLVQKANSRVVDSSVQQLVPNSAVTSSNIGLTSKTYTTTGNVSYKLALTNGVTLTTGSYITQLFANTVVAANLQALGNVTSSNVVPVIFVSGGITALSNTIAVNGTTVAGNVISATILGTVNSAGNVTIAANTVVGTSNIWTNASSSLTSSTTTQALFLLNSPAFTPTPDTTP